MVGAVDVRRLDGPGRLTVLLWIEHGDIVFKSPTHPVLQLLHSVEQLGSEGDIEVLAEALDHLGGRGLAGRAELGGVEVLDVLLYDVTHSDLGSQHETN